MTATTADPRGAAAVRAGADAPEADRDPVLRRLPARDRDPHPRADRAPAQRPGRRPARGSTWTSSPGCRRAGRRRPGSCPPSSARSSSPSSSAAITFPIGIGAAVYLAEYAPDNRFTRLLQTNISNLAGVPSIIYGIFGLAIFVRLLGLRSRSCSRAPRPSPSSSCRSSSSPASRPSRPSRRPSARAPTRSARANGRWSAAPSSRRPRPGS